MKITTADIEHMALDCISTEMEDVFSLMGAEDDQMRAGILGELNGILILADALKAEIRKESA